MDRTPAAAIDAELRDDPSAARLARILGLFFGGLAAATFALVVFGALVRAHGAGLSCPDWPLCFGEVVPRFDFRVALEWGHRLLAGCVSLGLLAGTLGVLRAPALRARLRWPLGLAWAVLAVQVVLGGLTVLLGLAPWTVTSHLLVGNTFCASLLWIALDLRAAGGARRDGVSRLGAGAALLALACALGVVAQMALGGLVSSHYAGLACPAFPTCDGVRLAPTLSGLVGIHVLHRLNAFALLVGFVALAFVTRRAGRAGRLATHALHLLLLQVAVGAANVLLRLPVEVTALHSALAAGIVLVTTLLVREVLYARAAAPARVATPRAAQVMS